MPRSPSIPPGVRGGAIAPTGNGNREPSGEFGGDVPANPRSPQRRYRGSPPASPRTPAESRRGKAPVPVPGLGLVQALVGDGHDLLQDVARIVMRGRRRPRCGRIPGGGRRGRRDPRRYAHPGPVRRRQQPRRVLHGGDGTGRGGNGGTAPPGTGSGSAQRGPAPAAGHAPSRRPRPRTLWAGPLRRGQAAAAHSGAPPTPAGHAHERCGGRSLGRAALGPNAARSFPCSHRV